MGIQSISLHLRIGDALQLRCFWLWQWRAADCALESCRVHESKAFAASFFKRLPAVASAGPVPYTSVRSFVTRSTPVLMLGFTRSNLLLAAGPRLPSEVLV